MKTSRRTRYATALIALFSVLFMQLAVAAYACPGISTGISTGDTAAAAMAAPQHMEGCTGMADEDLPPLCFAMSQEGTQSLDKPASPVLAQPVPVILVPFVDTADSFRQPAALWRADVDHLHSSAAPPLSILHCCFRI